MKQNTKIILGLICVSMLIGLAAYIIHLNANDDLKKNTNAKAPGEVTWEVAIEILNTGQVTEVMQSHDLEVVITLEDGSQVKTIEPSIDAIFREIELCGFFCNEITLITE